MISEVFRIDEVFRFEFPDIIGLFSGEAEAVRQFSTFDHDSSGFHTQELSDHIRVIVSSKDGKRGAGPLAALIILVFRSHSRGLLHHGRYSAILPRTFPDPSQ